jgi:uncharacterized phage protein (TIGR01671 family)
MSREIKFRAWNTVIGGWAGDEPSSLEELILEDNSVLSTKALREDFYFMQYTGLKDRDGADLYEEDIITDGEHSFIVKWQSGGFVLCPLSWSKHKPYLGQQCVQYEHENYIKEDCKVIGNIYENKELLDERDDGELIKTNLFD